MNSKIIELNNDLKNINQIIHQLRRYKYLTSKNISTINDHTHAHLESEIDWTLKTLENFNTLSNDDKIKVNTYISSELSPVLEILFKDIIIDEYDLEEWLTNEYV